MSPRILDCLPALDDEQDLPIPMPKDDKLLATMLAVGAVAIVAIVAIKTIHGK